MRLCVVCKKQIEEGRIDAIPGTRICVEHGKEIQKYGGESEFLHLTNGLQNKAV